MFWRSIRDSERAEAFASYIRTMPRGAFIEDAKEQLRQLGGDPAHGPRRALATFGHLFVLTSGPVASAHLVGDRRELRRFGEVRCAELDRDEDGAGGTRRGRDIDDLELEVGETGRGAEGDVAYLINDNWRFGINVANAFDDEHWESFGGDIIERRALGNITFTW